MHYVTGRPRSGNRTYMGQMEPTDDEPQDRPLRRILVIAAIVVGVIVLIGVAIYAGAFLILAPIMH